MYNKNLDLPTKHNAVNDIATILTLGGIVAGASLTAINGISTIQDTSHLPQLIQSLGLTTISVAGFLASHLTFATDNNM